MLAPEIAQTIAKDAKRVTLKLAIDRQGNIFLWPVPPIPEDGNDNPWNQSQREVAELAEHTGYASPLIDQSVVMNLL